MSYWTVAVNAARLVHPHPVSAALVVVAVVGLRGYIHQVLPFSSAQLMETQMRNPVTFLGVALVIIGVAQTGCKGPPAGNSGGIVPVTESTHSAKWSGLPDPADLAQGCDQVAQHLAADIGGIVERDFGGYRITLVLGDIDNQTSSVPTTDLNYMRHRIKDTLMQSKLFRDNVRVVENQARWKALRNRELGDQSEDDLLQTSTKPGPDRLNPQYTLFLSGDASAVHNGPTHLYYIAFKLTRASDGEEVFVHPYEVKYQQAVSKNH